jgi:P27 family predicted phage terminase small subunit
MAGRKPIPTNLKLLHGNPGKRPIIQDDLAPEISIPCAPDHLSEDALAEWHRITAELELLGLLSQMDRSALAAYCQCYGRWAEAERGIKGSGLITETTNGNVIQNPLVGIANTAMQLMKSFLVEFGMTPSARAKVKTGGETKKSKFAGLMCGVPDKKGTKKG